MELTTDRVLLLFALAAGAAGGFATVLGLVVYSEVREAIRQWWATRQYLKREKTYRGY